MKLWKIIKLTGIYILFEKSYNIRFATTEMMCMFCQEVQPIGKTCSNPLCMKEVGKYYCPICKFIDSDPLKKIYHCPYCGICRIGMGLDIDFFHCMICNACLNLELKGNHKCIENNFKSNCPICSTDLFNSRDSSVLMLCGHSIHSKCKMKYENEGNFTCPLCFKSTYDMKEQWKQLDILIKDLPVPKEYEKAICSILCKLDNKHLSISGNDCLQKSDNVPFHFYGLKCTNKECGSYNTKITGTSDFPTPEQMRNS